MACNLITKQVFKYIIDGNEGSDRTIVFIIISFSLLEYRCPLALRPLTGPFALPHAVVIQAG